MASLAFKTLMIFYLEKNDKQENVLMVSTMQLSQLEKHLLCFKAQINWSLLQKQLMQFLPQPPYFLPTPP